VFARANVCLPVSVVALEAVVVDIGEDWCICLRGSVDLSGGNHGPPVRVAELGSRRDDAQDAGADDTGLKHIHSFLARLAK
jgi:hypothetical protein